FLMALTIFIDFTGFGLVIPLLPFWAEHLGANALGVGLILTTYALAQFICTPLLGALSDRFGRKRIILISLCVEVVSFALTALASTLPILLVARVIGGIGASNIGSAQAVVSDVTPPEKRAAGMGAIGAAIGLGFVVGPALGGLFSPHGEVTPFWIALGLAACNALLVFFLLPETNKKHEGATAAHSELGSLFSGWSKVSKQGAVLSLVLVNLLYTLAFTGMETVFPLLTQRNFGWHATQNGYVFTYVGIVIVLMQGGLVGRLVKLWGERNLMLGGLVLLGAGLLMLIWSTNLALLLGAVGVLSIGDGAVTPTSSAVLSLITPSGEQGEILGFAQGMGGLGRTIGPLIAGSLFTLSPGAPFLIGGAFAMLAILVTLPVMGRIQRTIEARKLEAHKESAQDIESSHLAHSSQP
ncbi:MAG TPA: MFS transporter, partial [Ktedonobacteraceae bacterium]|nr:MFS transporter [Ktedonobacteraceae bacterium]